MIITLSGVTGTGKSFFKNAISKELKFKNLAIVTTRAKRENEVNGIDKEFVTDSQFNQLVQENAFFMNFEFLGALYAYRKDKICLNENYVTEVHYSTIYEFKKNAPEVFSIYLIPYDVERAKDELRKRNLHKKVEQKRLQEIEEQMKEYSNNSELQKQFDYVFVNDYSEESKEKLLKIIKEKIQEESLILN